ncbi:MAG TPA: SAM-dependent methyltransferase [Gemmatimonadales bacterium]
MSAPIISNISDTARWVAVYRAMETERPDAIFRDPYARRLAGPRGEAIVKGMPRGEQMAWAMIVRTAVMDEILMRVIDSGEVDCVLNLAAGLDARPWRLPLPASLQWFDVDHFEMIDLKTRELGAERTACRYEGVPLDLANREERRALFDRVNATARRVLLITEGLLVYLPAEGVGELAEDLHAQPNFRLWLMDLASPGLLKMLSKRWGKGLAAAKLPFQFGPAEGTGFFSPYGWREAEWRSQIHEGLRLDRVFPLARLWMFVGRFMGKRRQAEFRRFSGIALLARNGQSGG